MLFSKRSKKEAVLDYWILIFMSKQPTHKFPWIQAAINRAKASKSASKPLSVRVGDRFSLTIGVTVFGTPSYFSLDAAISEFKSFVEQNSKVSLKIVH